VLKGVTVLIVSDSACRCSLCRVVDSGSRSNEVGMSDIVNTEAGMSDIVNTEAGMVPLCHEAGMVPLCHEAGMCHGVNERVCVTVSTSGMWHVVRELLPVCGRRSLCPLVGGRLCPWLMFSEQFWRVDTFCHCLFNGASCARQYAILLT